MPTDSSVTGAARPHPPAWSWPRLARNAAIIGPAIGLAVWFGVEGVWPNVSPKNFGVVQEGALYRSGELTTAALKEVVQQHGIRTIVDFGAHDSDPDGEIRAQRAAESLGVRRVVLPLNGDATGDPNRYVDALRIITDPQSGPVLVHCAAGAQRTGCAVALYRDLILGWEPEAALAETRQFGHDPEDNPHLETMFHTWRDEIGRALIEGGAIDPAAAHE